MRYAYLMELPKDIEALRARVRQGESFKYFPFYGHTRSVGRVTASCLSQWYEAEFRVGEDRYATAEHYMMAEKARLFGDGRALGEILAAATPAEAKRLGRTVRGFDASRWAERRSAVVILGNVQKFSQHAELRAFLLGCGSVVFVEASPRDRIWGIGLGRANPAAADPFSWRGLNLLGFALSAVAEQLASP